MKFPKFKGSKTPWEVDNPGLDGIYIVTSKSGPVFKVYGNGQAEANAKLGAAAPDLLTACITALKIFESAGIKNPDVIIKAVNKAL